MYLLSPCLAPAQIVHVLEFTSLSAIDAWH